MYSLRLNLYPRIADVKWNIRFMRKTDVSEVLKRLMQATGADNKSRLGKAYGISPQAISSWESRGSIPYALCVTVAEEKRVSIDWLLTGEGSMLRDTNVTSVTKPAQTHREEAILALFRELEEEDQREIQSAAEEKKRLKTLEQRLAELEAVVADIKKMA